MQTLQESLESKLNSAVGKTALTTWFRHFAALANEPARAMYRGYRTRLNNFLGHVGQGIYKSWIPIGEIGQGTKALYIKCQGRKVAIARFRRDNPDFTISFTTFAQDKNPSNEDSVIEDKKNSKIPYRKTLVKLRQFAEKRKGNEGANRNPEGKLEAWLSEQLTAKNKKTRSVVFNQKTPLDYENMYLQVSSPFSASANDGIGVRVAAGANGHSDILIRRGNGLNSRFSILELKAREERNNISKALCQAFAYAYCYYHTFNTLSDKSTDRANVLSVLGYNNPWWSENPPPLEAIAVVPAGFEKIVIKEAKERGLFSSKAVLDKDIKLFLWTYKVETDGNYIFNEINEVLSPS